MQHDDIIMSEDCQPCRLSAALGMYLSVCKEVSGDATECDLLYEKLTKEEITADEVFKLVREKVKDKPDQIEILNYIDELKSGKADEKTQ
jgi:hypothetical protein